MPIAQPPIIPSVIPPEDPVSVLPEKYRHSIVSADTTSLAALITHIEGQSWIVYYYSQVLGADEQPSEFQPNQLGVYQQYHLIKNMELKLQGPLSPSDESETSVMSLTGEAIIYPFLKPNKGDVLIGDIGDGYAGMFVVNSVTKQTLMSQTCYRVSLTLARYMDETVETEINSRVVKTSYFDNSFLIYGQNPVLTNEQMQAKQKLQYLEVDLLTHWLNDFYSNRFSTIVIPGQPEPRYDKYLVDALLSVVDLHLHDALVRIEQKNIDGINILRKMDFWKALIERDLNKLTDCFKTYTFMSSNYVPAFPVYRSIRYSGLHYFVAPGDGYSSVDKDYEQVYNPEVILLSSLNDVQVDLSSLLFNNSIGEFKTIEAANYYLSTEVPAIHPVTIDDGYIFSNHYYNNNVAGMSKLELLVRDFFNTGNVNREVLYSFVESMRGWGRLEKYYYVPVLIILIKHALRGL